MPDIHIGTSGWNYKSFVTRLYPPGTPKIKYLETYSTKLLTVVFERKLTKTVISSKARNFIVLRIQALKISPYGRNDKKRGFSFRHYCRTERILLSFFPPKYMGELVQAYSSGLLMGG